MTSASATPRGCPLWRAVWKRKTKALIVSTPWMAPKSPARHQAEGHPRGETPTLAWGTDPTGSSQEEESQAPVTSAGSPHLCHIFVTWTASCPCQSVDRGDEGMGGCLANGAAAALVHIVTVTTARLLLATVLCMEHVAGTLGTTTPTSPSGPKCLA